MSRRRLTYLIIISGGMFVAVLLLALGSASIKPAPLPPPALLTPEVAQASYTFGSFDTLLLNDLRDWRTYGGNAVHVEAFWDRLQGSPAAALNPSEVTLLNKQIGAARNLGLAVYLSVAIQYPPAWARKAIAKFKNQRGQEWTAPAGKDVRDWIWTATGRNLIRDFIARTLSAVDRSQLAGIRTGGGFFNELHYPREDDKLAASSALALSDISYWGYGSAAQTGADLAIGQSVTPLPGYVPFSGTADEDSAWTEWYLDSLKNFMVDLIAMHRQAGWQGPLFVLHPGFSLRSDYKPSELRYRIELAEGTDVARMIEAYRNLPEVWPGCTWIDGKDAGPDLRLDSQLAPWRKIKKEAELRGKAGRLYGENIGGGDDANMNEVFRQPMENGYTVLFWLNYPRLVDGTSGTLTNMGRNIRLFKSRAGS